MADDSYDFEIRQTKGRAPTGFAASRAVDHAVQALWHVSGCKVGQIWLRASLPEVAAAAMSGHANADKLAALLSRIA